MSLLCTQENPVEVSAECCGWIFTRKLTLGQRTDKLDPMTDEVLSFGCWLCGRSIEVVQFRGGEFVTKETLF